MRNLKEIFEKYNIPCSQKIEENFNNFFDILITENSKMNLTAITEENDVLIKHFLDSVLAEKFIPKNASVIDVGSGAGFPAIPLKIVRDDLNITMIDSLLKRVNFLNKTTALLNLNDCAAYHSRAEDFAKTKREGFDISVSRAVAPLNTLLEYVLPLTKVGGTAIIYKSSKLDEELKTAQNVLKILGGKIEEIKEFFIEEQQIYRNILIIKKISKTPLKYPRGKNQPRTNPIV